MIEILSIFMVCDIKLQQYVGIFNVHEPDHFKYWANINVSLPLSIDYPSYEHMVISDNSMWESSIRCVFLIKSFHFIIIMQIFSLLLRTLRVCLVKHFFHLNEGTIISCYAPLILQCIHQKL